MRSIQRRLGVGLLFILLLVGVVMVNASIWLVDLGLRRYLQNGLRDEAELLLIATVRGPAGIQLDELRLSPAYQRPLSGSYFRVDLPDQVWRSRSSWDFQLERPTRSGLQHGLVDGPGGQELLVYRADFRRFGSDLSITAAQDYRPLSLAFTQVRWLLSGIGALALLVVLLLQWLNVRAALHPLERVRLQVLQLQQGRRGRLDSEADRELAPLVEQINSLLQHTEGSLRRSRNAVGNLGHALKTPLAVLRSLLTRAELDALQPLRRQMDDQLDVVEQRLARELNRARLSGEVLPGAHFECDQELPPLCDTLRMIHPHLRRLSCLAPPGLRLPWDREDLLEVLGNLLDNACKWALTQVSLSIEQDGQELLLRIEDDGPGVAEQLRSSLLARGSRLDEQVPGHGLGLAIVRDTLDAWGGTLQLGNAALGGLRVDVRLPLPN